MSEYLVQRFGGTLMPDTASLQTWLTERAAEGWQLVTVSEGVGYFVRTTPPARTRRSDPDPQ